MEYSSAMKLIIVAAVMFCVLGGVTLLSHMYSLNRIKNKTVGDGQHGMAIQIIMYIFFRSKAKMRIPNLSNGIR